VAVARTAARVALAVRETEHASRDGRAILHVLLIALVRGLSARDLDSDILANDIPNRECGEEVLIDDVPVRLIRLRHLRHRRSRLRPRHPLIDMVIRPRLLEELRLEPRRAIDRHERRTEPNVDIIVDITRVRRGRGAARRIARAEGAEPQGAVHARLARGHLRIPLGVTPTSPSATSRSPASDCPQMSRRSL